MSSPDWRVRDVTRLKRGGARSGEGGRTSLQEAWTRELRRECVWSSLVLVRIVDMGVCLKKVRSCVSLRRIGRVVFECLCADRRNGVSS